MPSLQETKALLQEYDISPKKSLGQNFLVSEKIVENIIALNHLTPKDLVIEIGSGMGALTRLLLEKTERVDAYEIDKRMIVILEDILSQYGHLNLYHTDILQVDLRKKYQNIPQIKVIANLPYYITSKIIEKVICEIPSCDTLCFMMQKEAAERLLLHENQTKYGVTAILLNLFGEVTNKITVSAESFYPKPKIDSQILLMKAHDCSVFRRQLQKNSTFKITDFKKFLEQSFSMRRKTLINNWRKGNSSRLVSALERSLQDVNLTLKVRPEQISPEKFWKLYLNMANYMN